MKVLVLNLILNKSSFNNLDKNKNFMGKKLSNYERSQRERSL
jgi:hypothetical protein